MGDRSPRHTINGVKGVASQVASEWDGPGVPGADQGKLLCETCAVLDAPCPSKVQDGHAARCGRCSLNIDTAAKVGVRLPVGTVASSR